MGETGTVVDGWTGTVVDGFGRVVGACPGMMRGANVGKTVVRVAPEA